VGKVGFTTYPFSLSYRFRFDSEDFRSRRGEVNASVNYYPVALSAAYLSIKRDPVLQTKEVVSMSSAVNMTRHWSWLTNSAYDMLDERLSAAYSGVAYNDECTNLTFMAGKDYTNLQDIRPATTFWVQVSLRNLE
jgi:LPS-assembly protein